MSRERRREMVDREHPALSTLRQCALMGISRSSVYYRPRAPSQKDLALMKQIDQQYLATPFYGSRRMKVWLDRQGHRVNRKRIQRLMRAMGLQAIYRRPRTSQPGLGHKVHPYLLGGMEFTRPNQVWAADITYVPMARGFLYLVAIMDWYSRYVVAWRLSNTMDADFCVEALEEALGKGKPEVFNTDQGSQFTSEGFTGILARHGVKISMDGKGRYADNIFMERLWRTVKYEEVYLKAYSNGREAKAGLEAYLHFYNTQRPHQALGYRTPAEVFSGDSVQSDEQSKERRWLPTRALVDLGKTAGPSLNIAPILRSAGAFGGAGGGLQSLWRARWRDRTRLEALADRAGASLRGRWVGGRVSGREVPSGWESNSSQSGQGAAELLLPRPAIWKMQGQPASGAGEPSGQG